MSFPGPHAAHSAQDEKHLFVELGRLSSGQAARMCGKERVDFLMSLTRIGIPVSNLRPEDTQAEIDFARNG